MKVKITKKEKKFEPIELKLTIETEDELKELYHRINISIDDINDLSDNLTVDYSNEDNLDGLFYELNKLCESIGLTKK